MDASGWPGGIAVVLALVVTALLARLASISGSLTRTALERLRDEGVPRAALLLSFYRRRNLLGQLILFAQMTVLGLGAVALIDVSRLWLPDLLDRPAVLTVPVVAFAFVSVLITNILPAYRREETSLRPLPRVIWFLSPVYALFLLPTLLLQRIEAVFVSEDESRAMKEEEILQLVETETEEGAIEQEEREMIEGVFEFGETTVREIMVPRIDIVCAELHTDSADLLRLIEESRHSRIPIYEERVDHIKGVIYAKDLLHALAVGERLDIPKMMRPPYFVPENKKIDELLKEFKTERIHMAIVVDEYGGTSGIVTLEDVIEEILGEIHDEFDEEEQLFRWSGDGQMLIADARMEIESLGLLLNAEFPRNGYETLGGFIYNHLGHVPDPKETFVFNDLQMRIVDVVGQRITHVEIRKKPADTNASEEPPEA